ncbi:MAG: XRE family transcriptional regulator [Candidatus Methylomirabilota bacterium]
MAQTARQLADRIRARRNVLGLNQKALAELAGFSALQTISQIEKGQRDVKAWELVRLAKALRMSMTDLLADTEPGSDPVVMWRNQPVEAHKDREETFLGRCRRYAHVANAVGTESHLPLPKVQADPTSFDWGHAQGLAHEVWQQLGLGTRPAVALIPILEERYGIQIWYMDLGREGSAACVVGDFGAAILMNSSEAPWRRNFNLGHELFHIITWGSFPPDKVQKDPGLEKQMDRLANAFSSSLLLPAELVIPELDKRVSKRKISYADLIGLAREFDVSTEALLWRLYTLKRLEKDIVEKLLENDEFRDLDRASMRGRWWDPSPLPERFVRLAFLAYQKGRLSRSRLAQYLETSLPGLPAHLMEYGLDETADYSTAVHTA